MTERERERRPRRGDTPGGSPSRRATGRPEPVGGPSQAFRARGDEPGERPEPDRARRRPGPRARGPRTTALSRVLGRLSTRRAALLALVVCALALSVAVPLHTYLSQRDNLAAQLQQQTALRAQQTQLQHRQQQLSDPAQVEAEARSRLHYVLPGQTPYVVQLPGDQGPSVPGQPAPSQPVPTGTWYQTLWNTVVGSH